MNIHVLNREKELVGMIDVYNSIIWTTRYFKAGDFELYLRATAKNIDILRKDYYLCREQDIIDNEYHNVMIIKNIQITTDVEQGNFLIITGKCLKSILSRRIIWQQTNLIGRVEIGIRRIITENVISPSITSRKIEGLTLDYIQNFSDTMDIQVTGDNVAEWLEKICTTYGMGWDIFIKDKSFVFSLWKGTDRSYNQSENPHVVFSPEYDNLIASDYKMNSENFKNVALVAGEGEGLDRKTYVVGEASDLDRYELYVDSRDLSTNSGEISDVEYNNMLREKGLESLAQTSITENFEGTVEPEGNYTLNVDYFLGDIVQVINEYGIISAARITEIIDSEDDQGRTVIPTYSTMEV